MSKSSATAERLPILRGLELSLWACLGAGSVIQEWHNTHLVKAAIFSIVYAICILVRRAAFPMTQFYDPTIDDSRDDRKGHFYFKGTLMGNRERQRQERDRIAHTRSNRKRLALQFLLAAIAVFYIYCYRHLGDAHYVATYVLSVIICGFVLFSSTTGHFLVPLGFSLVGVLFTFHRLPDTPVVLSWLYSASFVLSLICYSHLEMDLSVVNMPGVDRRNRNRRTLISCFKVTLAFLLLLSFYGRILPPKEDHLASGPQNAAGRTHQDRLTRSDVKTMFSAMRGLQDKLGDRTVGALAKGFDIPPGLVAPDETMENGPDGMELSPSVAGSGIPSGLGPSAGGLPAQPGPGGDGTTRARPVGPPLGTETVGEMYDSLERIDVLKDKMLPSDFRQLSDAFDIPSDMLDGTHYTDAESLSLADLGRDAKKVREFCDVLSKTHDAGGLDNIRDFLDTADSVASNGTPLPVDAGRGSGSVGRTTSLGEPGGAGMPRGPGSGQGSGKALTSPSSASDHRIGGGMAGKDPYESELKHLREALPEDTLRDVAKEYGIPEKRLAPGSADAVRGKDEEPQMGRFIQTAGKIAEKQKERSRKELLKKLVDLSTRLLHLGVILSCVGLGVFALVKLLAPSDGKKPRTGERIDRHQRRQVLQAFREIKEGELSVTEEIIRRYHLFLDVMKETKLHRESFMPPTNYYRVLKDSFPALEPQLRVITETFCDTLYGRIPVDPSRLKLYRDSIDSVVRNFV